MDLHNEESVIKVYHHHPTTFVMRAVNYVIISIPFYFVGSFFSSVLGGLHMFYLYAGITLLFGTALLYDLTLFFLDRLVITNRRIIHVDWKSALSRHEAEAELLDIQDISTEEKGIFSALKVFDFGLFKLETASTKTSIIFNDAPDPEGIKHFIYRLYSKPSRIGGAPNVSSIHDTARQTQDEEAATARRQ